MTLHIPKGLPARIAVALALTVAAIVTPAQAAVTVMVGVASPYGSASESRTFESAESAHGSAASTVLGASAIVDTGLSSCLSCLSVGGAAVSVGQIDTDPMRMQLYARGDDGGNASVLVSASDTITFRGQVPPGQVFGTLFLDIRIEIARFAAFAAPDAAASTGLNFFIMTPPDPAIEDSVARELFTFGAVLDLVPGEDRLEYAYTSGELGGAEFFSSVPSVYETTLELPVFIGQRTFDWIVGASIDAYGSIGGFAAADALNSVYLGVRGDFDSANGYGYRGFTPAAALPEPGGMTLAALAALAALVMAASSRKRRRHAAGRATTRGHAAPCAVLNFQEPTRCPAK